MGPVERLHLGENAGQNQIPNPQSNDTFLVQSGCGHRHSATSTAQVTQVQGNLYNFI